MQNVIALIFDFDDTLAPDSTSGFLDNLGVNPDEFWKESVVLQEQGWDPVPAYLYKLIELSKSKRTGGLITRDQFQDWGSRIKFFSGVTSIFKRLKDFAAKVNPQVRLEFYLVSSGVRDVIASSKIAAQFTDIWACDFHYGRKGELLFPKNVISFTDKTRYIFQISKGLIGPEYRSKPFEVNRSVLAAELRVPFRHMIFTGDGYTDIPCFSLVRKEGGVSFGVYDPSNSDKWSRAWGYIEDHRVTNLAPADYGKNSGLTHNLMMAISKIAAEIRLGSSSYQG